MTESTLKSALVKLIRYEHPDWLVFRHEDKFTSGLPDISVTGGMHTSWWEVKFIRDGLSTKGVQEETMKKLHRAGIAYYIIYSDMGGKKETRVVKPGDLHTWRDYLAIPGFDHQWILDRMKEIHESTV